MAHDIPRFSPSNATLTLPVRSTFNTPERVPQAPLPMYALTHTLLLSAAQSMPAMSPTLGTGMYRSAPSARLNIRTTGSLYGFCDLEFTRYLPSGERLQ